jgi:hypothetical protein
MEKTKTLQLSAPVMGYPSITRNNQRKRIQMKLSLFLFTAAVIAPAFVLVGLNITAGLSAAAIVGVAAMLCQDYGRPLSYRTVSVAAKRVETLPMAA